MILSGKVALVTGASRGIGKHIALALAQAGADVACAATEASHCAGTVQAILPTGQRAVALGARLEHAPAVSALVEQATQALGPVDILVNNAGVPQVKPVLDMTEEDWQRVLDVNAKGAFLCAQAVARQLVARHAPGVVLNIGSIAGQNAFPLRLAYCASKAALHHMTRVMAVEWAPHQIRVNCLAPGYIQTDITEGLARQGLLDVDKLRGRVPQRRLGTPQDIAEVAVYLVSDAAPYMTGSIVTVDGGWTAYGFT
ncbi:MAG TPA: 3-oxoacyl-ACP reductase family protein [bacterium]|nr:3-oxoacyl-ACP reductase family protein [bacterium]